ncbi:MFS transporter [Marinobacter sp. W-8]|uniref:MFS transporter n=1 Tax=Marinobacter sp. W-8 TaxID=3369658 RepID=UPI0037C59D3B
MRFPSSTAFALLGAGLIAISFGLARFAFGLFIPPIRADLSLSPHVIGIIGALPLISFALASVVAPWCADRLGARNTAMASGVFGVVGLALISQSAGALSLGLGVFACGICTGLMMPALTAAMQALVRRSMHGRVSSVMNAGTSVGVMVAVPTVLFLAGAAVHGAGGLCRCLWVLLRHWHCRGHVFTSIPALSGAGTGGGDGRRNRAPGRLRLSTAE